MKKIYLLAAVSVLTLGWAEVWAAEATGQGNISAKIVAPVTVTEAQALDFGTILAPTSGTKKVKISATDGSRCVDGGDKGILVSTSKGEAGLYDNPSVGFRWINWDRRFDDSWQFCYRAGQQTDFERNQRANQSRSGFDS